MIAQAIVRDATESNNPEVFVPAIDCTLENDAAMVAHAPLKTWKEKLEKALGQKGSNKKLIKSMLDRLKEIMLDRSGLDDEELSELFANKGTVIDKRQAEALEQYDKALGRPFERDANQSTAKSKEPDLGQLFKQYKSARGSKEEELLGSIKKECDLRYDQEDTLDILIEYASGKHGKSAKNRELNGVIVKAIEKAALDNKPEIVIKAVTFLLDKDLMDGKLGRKCYKHISEAIETGELVERWDDIFDVNELTAEQNEKFIVLRQRLFGKYDPTWN